MNAGDLAFIGIFANQREYVSVIQIWSFNYVNQTTVCLTPNLVDAGSTIDVWTWDNGALEGWTVQENVLNNNQTCTLQTVWYTNGNIGIYEYDPSNAQLYHTTAYGSNGTAMDVKTDVWNTKDYTNVSVAFDAQRKAVVETVDFKNGSHEMSASTRIPTRSQCRWKPEPMVE